MGIHPANDQRMLAAKQTESKTSEANAKRATPADGEHDVLQTNPAWQALALGPLGVQTMLAVSQPDDPYEREADQIAERVMRMPVERVQRKCDACTEAAPNKQEEERAVAVTAAARTCTAGILFGPGPTGHDLPRLR